MLTGKKIIVTGSNGALGKATVEAAQDYGALVTGFDISYVKNDSYWRKVDLLSRQEIKREVEELDRVDGLINVAGGFAMGNSTFEENSEEWTTMQDLNVNSLRNVLSTVVPRMVKAKRGSIVNIGAQAAMRGAAYMSSYIVAKSAVMRITESLSEEVNDYGINVNAVLPSIIDTPTNRAEMPEADFSTWVTPASIAEVICFLLSDQAKAINGALIPVSGTK